MSIEMWHLKYIRQREAVICGTGFICTCVLQVDPFQVIVSASQQRQRRTHSADKAALLTSDGSSESDTESAR